MNQIFLKIFIKIILKKKYIKYEKKWFFFYFVEREAKYSIFLSGTEKVSKGIFIDENKRGTQELCDPPNLNAKKRPTITAKPNQNIFFSSYRLVETPRCHLCPLIFCPQNINSTCLPTSPTWTSLLTFAPFFHLNYQTAIVLIFFGHSHKR